MRLNPESNGMLKILASEPDKIQSQREDLLAEKEVLVNAINSCKKKLGEAWVHSMYPAGSTQGTASPFHGYQPQSVKRRARDPIREYSQSPIGTSAKKFPSASSSPGESIASSQTSLGIHDTSPTPVEKGRGKMRSRTQFGKGTSLHLERPVIQSDEI
jgi:hypothetical protein